MKPCNYPEAHEAHMAINAECPWCGAHNPDQTEFATVADFEPDFS